AKRIPDLRCVGEGPVARVGHELRCAHGGVERFLCWTRVQILAAGMRAPQITAPVARNNLINAALPTRGLLIGASGCPVVASGKAGAADMPKHWRAQLH